MKALACVWCTFKCKSNPSFCFWLENNTILLLHCYEGSWANISPSDKWWDIMTQDLSISSEVQTLPPLKLNNHIFCLDKKRRLGFVNTTWTHTSSCTHAGFLYKKKVRKEGLKCLILHIQNANVWWKLFWIDQWFSNWALTLGSAK